MKEFKFLTKKDMTNELFFRVPKTLMYEPKYAKLSSDAKLLYSMLMDRVTLSIHNNWFDDENRAYVICEIDEVEIFLNCSRGTAVKCMKELEDYNLIIKKQQGQGKVNLIYVAYVEATKETVKTHLQFHKRMLNALKTKRKEKKEEYAIKKSKKCTSVESTDVDECNESQPLKTLRSQKNEFHGVQNSDGNNTYIKETEDVVVESKQSEKVKLVKEYGFDINDVQEKLVDNLDFDLLKDAVETTVAKCGKSFAYVYEVYRSLKDKVKTNSTKKSSKTNKYNNANSTKKDNNEQQVFVPKVKTRFHNITQTFTKYAPDELEKRLLESQRDKFDFVPSYGL